jgi:dolichol-phosphate mannosyltransferase
MKTRDQDFVLSVIIPCYNEEDVIEHTNLELNKALSCIDKYELVYINDGSTDNTLSILLDLQESNTNIKVLNLSRNFGHQPAVQAGLDYVSGNCVAIIDADLQDPPSLIPEMVDLWKSGIDVIYAVRKKRKENFFKRTSYFIFYRVQAYLSDLKIPLDSGDFCLMDKKVVDVMKQLSEKNKYLRGLRAWTGFKQQPLEYERSARFSGVSKYSLKMLFSLALSGIANFSIVPLRLISLTGISLFLISFAMFFFILIQKLFEFKIFGISPADVPGWTSLVLLFLIFSGLHFIFLGVIGEYLGRVYQEVKSRPPYLIESIHGFDRE